MTDTPTPPDHFDQGSVARGFDASVARAAADTIRWDEQRALEVLHEDPADLFNLLDAAIEVVASRGAPGFVDVLAVRIAEIIPEALP